VQDRRIRTPNAHNLYAVGSDRLCAPYQWTKQVASHWGGTRNGTIVHWPKATEISARRAASSITSLMSHLRFWRPG
jgi:hypothetical protein